MRDIERRIKKLEQGEKPNALMEWYNMHPVRIPDKNGDWPEKEEDRRLGRHVVLIVRGEDGKNNEAGN